MSAKNFDRIEYSTTYQQLSIKDGTTVVREINLCDKTVKLAVQRLSNGDLTVEIEEGDTGAFSSDLFTVSMKEKTNKPTKVYFGTQDAASTIKLNHPGGPTSEGFGEAGVYSLIIVGADDIRNGLTAPPKELVAMEQQIVSFEIKDDLFNIRYHNSITPNV